MSNEVSVETQYNVIIDSIGTANPSVSKYFGRCPGNTSGNCSKSVIQRTVNSF